MASSLDISSMKNEEIAKKVRFSFPKAVLKSRETNPTLFFTLPLLYPLFTISLKSWLAQMLFLLLRVI